MTAPSPLQVLLDLEVIAQREADEKDEMIDRRFWERTAS
jgi:hypothetical protein